MEKMECRLHVVMRGSLAALTDSVSELERRVTNVEGHTAPSEDDEQEDIDPLESYEWGRPPSDADPAMGRELKSDLPQGGLTLVQQYTGTRSAWFKQMGGSPSGNHDRRESIILDRPHDVRSEESELANNLWMTCIEALFASLDEAKCMKSVQPNKQQEILTNFLRTAHIYKPSDGCKIQRGTRHYTFGEVISKFEGMLAQ